MARPHLEPDDSNSLRGRAQNIYVEILMPQQMERLWEYTQTPELHQRWDLRFSSITYLPRPDLTQPQQFLYTTRIGFGLAILGKGETVGDKQDASGNRTSALKFWSEQPISLIEKGSGYWKYEFVPEGIRFLTEYTYRTRFGGAGAILDRLIFRPLMGWATAWSFDRLRLWLEHGIEPAISLERSLLYAVARLTLAFVWIYQGVVPKLLFRDTGELTLLRNAHVVPGHEETLLLLVGVGEVVFGILMIFFWRSRLLLWLTLTGLFMLGTGALFSQPRVFVAPFNPLTLNVALSALAIIGLVVGRNLPSARRCRRKRPEKTR